MEELNYNKLLDDWAELVLKRADKYDKMKDDYEIGSFKYGYYKGLAEAYRMSVAELNRMERKTKINLT